MKKILHIFIVLLIIPIYLALITCQKDHSVDKESISFKELPQGANSFIIDHFSEADVSSVVKYQQALSDGTLYLIYFTTEHIMTFNDTGVWVEIGGAEIPWSVFSENEALLRIKNYIQTNYLFETPTSIHIKDNREYLVNLGSSVKLLFNSQGQFINKH